MRTSRQIESAEADFREATALAQTMNAKAWELRATVEPRAHARGAWPSRRSARDACRHLRLVHRGLRHARSEGRQSVHFALVEPRLVRQAENAKIEQPALFIAGKKDLVLSFGGGTMIAEMEKRVPDLRGKVIVEGAGHWVQAEKPGPVNEALLSFLKTTK